jgi:hypothetical protein
MIQAIQDSMDLIIRDRKDISKKSGNPSDQKIAMQFDGLEMPLE